MKPILRHLFLVVTLLFSAALFAQDSTAFNWKVESRKTAGNQYELIFSTPGANGWQLYAPDQVVSEVAMATVVFPDSAIRPAGNFVYAGKAVTLQSPIFEEQVNLMEGPVTWRLPITIQGTVPAQLQGKLQFSYGRGEEFYQGEQPFTVTMEGGVVANTRIYIPSIDVKNPAVACGDDDTQDKGLASIFFLGFLGGLIALVTPCVFPLIPLTVSFFTTRSGTRSRGVRNAFFYGLSIFLIYVLLSVPFHLLDQTNPEVLNNISTNVWLNLLFFVIFIFFALSFFGFYELELPSGLASKIDSKSGLGDFGGIFFMALTLAIVSFSCTGPILGSLLAGALSNDGGATQLTFGMGGFGLGLALPFALFALFPNWLQSLPRSGGWLTSVKVVLGFLELALAIKFLSNADLVEQWGLLKREVFIAIWILIGICIVLYLLGVIRFKHDSKPKFTPVRWSFIILFAAFTLYLVPGVTNTKAANLRLISGFPPPLSYSIYEHPVLMEHTIEPLRDYDAALQLARKEGKPLLIDFTGWACVNCRRMEENVWIDPDVAQMMKNDFVVVSLYVDERQNLPAAQQMEYTTRSGDKKSIITVGDKWATFHHQHGRKGTYPNKSLHARC